MNEYQRIYQYGESIHDFSLVSRPSRVTLINPGLPGNEANTYCTNRQFCHQSRFCCISTFRTCSVYVHLFGQSFSTIPKRFQVFVFK